MPNISTAFAERPPTVRSAVTNGSRLFVDGDGRGPWARRFRDLIFTLSSDQGDPETLSEARRTLIRRVATLVVECERMESAASEGGDMDIGAYTTAANALRRILADLGLERVARDVTPLDKYIERREGAGP